MTIRGNQPSQVRDLTAIVLCGGIGSRLRPITGDVIPKALVRIGSKTLLEHTLALLHSNDIYEVILGLSHHAALIKHYIRSHPVKGMSIRFSETSAPLGVAQSVAAAVAEHGIENSFLLTGADEICEGLDLRGTLDLHCRRQAVLTLVLTRNAPSEYATLSAEIDSCGQVLRFTRGPCGSGCVSTGIAIVAAEFIARVLAMDRTADVQGTALVHKLLPKLISEGLVFGQLCEMKNYMHVGTPQSYRKACEFFESPATSCPSVGFGL
jgi:D-glycero-alpha-D-manno-heptose 1-phosphate guanylyltransferase